jgi:secreted protein with Ig-like and vWFA domain
MGGTKHAMKKNTKALVVASKEVGLDVNANELRYVVMSRDQNAGKIIT